MFLDKNYTVKVTIGKINRKIEICSIYVQLRHMVFLNKIYSPRGVDLCPPISKSSMGTPLFISFLGFTYIELQVYKLLLKSECRFYLGGMTLNRFLFSKQKPCLLLVPLSRHGLFICIVHIKPSINASSLSIFRSIIHLNIKLCKKNRTKTTISL